jgi:hypothetical protein
MMQGRVTPNEAIYDAEEGSVCGYLNNITNVTTNEHAWLYLERTDLYQGYICTFLGIFGFFLNLIVFLIFSHNASFKETLYKYYKLQALFITLDLFIQALRPIYNWKEYAITKSYVANLYEIWLITYAASVLEMCAFVCLLIATLHYYIHIHNNAATLESFILFRISYIYVAIGLLVVSGLLFVYQLFEYSVFCYSHYDNCNIRVDEKLQRSVFHRVIEIFAFVLRDGFNWVCLVVLNVLIFVKVRSDMGRKLKLLKIQKSMKSSTPTTATAESNAAENTLNSIGRTKSKLTLMVVMSSVNCALGRLPIMVYFIMINFIKMNDTMSLFLNLAISFVFVSYSVNFFFLYFTNKKFKALFNQYLGKIRKCCCHVF